MSDDISEMDALKKKTTTPMLILRWKKTIAKTIPLVFKSTFSAILYQENFHSP